MPNLHPYGNILMGLCRDVRACYAYRVLGQYKVVSYSLTFISMIGLLYSKLQLIYDETIKADISY